MAGFRERYEELGKGLLGAWVLLTWVMGVMD